MSGQPEHAGEQIGRKAIARECAANSSEAVRWTPCVPHVDEAGVGDDFRPQAGCWCLCHSIDGTSGLARRRLWKTFERSQSVSSNVPPGARISRTRSKMPTYRLRACTSAARRMQAPSSRWFTTFAITMTSNGTSGIYASSGVWSKETRSARPAQAATEAKRSLAPSVEPGPSGSRHTEWAPIAPA